MKRIIFTIFCLLPLFILAQEEVEVTLKKKEIESIKKKVVELDRKLLKLNTEQNALIDDMITNSHKANKVESIAKKIKNKKEAIETTQKKKREHEKLLAKAAPDMYKHSTDTHTEWRSALLWDQLSFKRKRGKYRGHWAGFGVGFSALLTPENNVELEQEAAFLDLEHFKSWYLEVNPLELNIPIYKPVVGFTTGIGFSWSHYRFKNNFVLSQQDPTVEYIPATQTMDFNQLNVLQVNVPLLLEFNFLSSAKHQFHVGAGPIVSYVLAASQTTKWETETQQVTKKYRDGLSLNKFTYGATLRVGYSYFHLFANYSLVHLFEENEGPEVHPVSAGLILMNW